MESNELVRRLLERLNEITGHSESVSQEKQEETVFRRLDQAGKIISAIQKYLPKRIIDKILLNPEGVKVEGERRQVTVLFGDLSGFTSMSETMDPEQVVEVINKFFDTMVDIAERYGGHIDKFMGDALMVLFGAPVAHEDDPLRACLAAIEMLEAMDRFSAELKMPLAMSIGLNTGEVVALNVGSKGRMEYSVIGDGVNLAARLEKVATARQCVIGENTYRQVKGKIKLKKLKPVMVKGKSKPQNVYLILGRMIEEKTGGLRAGSIKLVGRMAEMEAIKQAIASAKAGQGRVVAISGEPGIGKSRLAKELELLARDEGFRFAKGKCYSYASATAYLPFIRQLNALFEIGERDSSGHKKDKIQEKLHAWDLGDFEPFLGSLLGLHYPEIEDLDPEKRKRKIFEGIGLVIDKSASKQPLALAFEDLQWGDSLSQELLEHIVEKIGDKSILICCDYRPELALPFIAKPYVENLFLSKLERREVFQMASALAGTVDVSDQVLDKLMERTEGNPLFVEEVTRHLISRRLVRREGENLVPGKRFGKMTLPATIAGVVLGRIDKLPEEHRRVLQYAAVVGKEFDREVLENLSKAAPESIQNSLDTLEHFEGLLYGKHVEGRKIYEFNSTTTYEAAYGTLLKTRRRELHGKVGLALEKAYQDNLEPHYDDLAHHYYNSDFEDKAVKYLHKAGDKARSLYANSEALDYYGKGIGVLKKAVDSKSNVLEKAELLWAEGSILRLIGKMDEALKKCKQAAKLAEGIGNRHAVHKYQLSAGIIHHVMGDMENTLKLLNRVIEEAEKAKDQRILITAYTNLSNLEMRSGNPAKAIEGFEKALTLCKETGEKREASKIYSSLGQVYEMMGEPQKAVEYYKIALNIAKEINYIEMVAVFNNLIGNPLMMMGDMEGAYKHFQESYSVSRKIGDKIIESHSSGSLGIINAMMGNYERALTYLENSYNASIECQDINQQLAININIGCIYQTWGLLDKALEKHSLGLKMAIELHNKSLECESRRNLGINYHLHSNYNLTIEHLLISIELAQGIGDPRMVSYAKANMGNAQAMLGDFEAASSILEEAMGTARQVGDPEVILATVRAVIDLNLETENFTEAEQYIQRALRIADETHNKREKAYGLLALASLMMASRSLDEMPGPLGEALELGREIKDRLLLARIYLVFARRALMQNASLDAERYIKDAIESLEETGARELEAKAHYWKAQLFKQQERMQDHDEEMEKARQVIGDILKDIPDDLKEKYKGRKEIAAILG
jgi:class 3 adenylate cyclase/tetratricopeptide (TPR) repeat protein